MHHQWIEGNLPVTSKCAVCDKTCGSVLRFGDYYSRSFWAFDNVFVLDYKTGDACGVGPVSMQHVELISSSIVRWVRQGQLRCRQPV